MTDSSQIILPAPDQASLVASSHLVASPCQQSQQNQAPNMARKAEQREVAIKDLSKTLRTINNACDPLSDYFKFQQCISPDLRVLLDLNQWILLSCAMRVAVKSNIDCEYMNISDPPESLKTAMEKAYTAIDTVIDSFTTSMKQTIKLLQSRLVNPDSSFSSNTPGILSSMNSESKLPQ